MDDYPNWTTREVDLIVMNTHDIYFAQLEIHKALVDAKDVWSRESVEDFLARYSSNYLKDVFENQEEYEEIDFDFLVSTWNAEMKEEWGE